MDTNLPNKRRRFDDKNNNNVKSQDEMLMQTTTNEIFLWFEYLLYIHYKIPFPSAFRSCQPQLEYDFKTNVLLLNTQNQGKCFSLFRSNILLELSQIFEPLELGNWNCKKRPITEEEKLSFPEADEVVDMIAPKLLPRLGSLSLSYEHRNRITGYGEDGKEVPTLVTLLVVSSEPWHEVYVTLLRHMWVAFCEGKQLSKETMAGIIKTCSTNDYFTKKMPAWVHWMMNVPDIPLGPASRSIPTGYCDFKLVKPEDLCHVKTKSPLVFIASHGNETGLQDVKNNDLKEFVKINSPRNSNTPMEGMIFCVCKAPFVETIAKQFPEITMVAYSTEFSSGVANHPMICLLLWTCIYIGEQSIYEPLLEKSAGKCLLPLNVTFQALQSLDQLVEVQSAHIFNPQGILSSVGANVREKIFNRRAKIPAVTEDDLTSRWQFVMNLAESTPKNNTPQPALQPMAIETPLTQTKAPGQTPQEASKERPTQAANAQPVRNCVVQPSQYLRTVELICWQHNRG